MLDPMRPSPTMPSFIAVSRTALPRFTRAIAIRAWPAAEAGAILRDHPNRRDIGLEPRRCGASFQEGIDNGPARFDDVRAL